MQVKDKDENLPRKEEKEPKKEWKTQRKRYPDSQLEMYFTAATGFITALAYSQQRGLSPHLLFTINTSWEW